MSKTENNSPFIADIHCHVIPGVDDGSSGMEESLEMLRIAEQEGITHIICTPHHKYVGKRGVTAKFEELKEKAAEAGIGIKLYFGAEVLYNHDLEQAVESGRRIALNDSQYMLVEFKPQDSYVRIKNGLDDVFGLGFTPVLAHAERYMCLAKQPANIEELHKMGARIQINASSITGEQGFAMKRLAHKLLKKQLVHYVATDAHSSESRSPKIKKCETILRKKYDDDYVSAILFENANNDFGLTSETLE